MKKFILSLAIFGIFMGSSCSEDFLEKMPLDELSPQAYFKPANDLKLYANRFYTLLPSHGGFGGGTFWTDRNSDNLVSGTEDMRLAGTRTIPSSGGEWTWNDIRQTNYFFQHCFSNADELDKKKIYIAEVKFFKAFLYFEKLKTFGNVPWLNEPLSINSADLFASRNQRNVVADSIIACLDYAISNLKPKVLAEPFRVNKEAAMLLKARICLYEGTWEKYHINTPFGIQGEDGSKFIQMAADAADQLIQMKTLSLYKGTTGKEYESLFNQVNYASNPEVIMWKKYDVGLGVYHNVGQYLPFGGGDVGVSKSLMDDYLCTDGQPISVSPGFLGYNSIVLETTNRDPRLAQSMLLPGDSRTINSPSGVEAKYIKPAIDQVGQFRATTGYCMNKGANLEYTEQLGSGGTLASIYFRYTEALLIYAEAKAELNTITQADLDKTINAIRDRVGMVHLLLNNITTDPQWDYPALAPVINEIRRERRIELAFESLRWDDIARWRAHHLITGQRPKGIKYVGSDLEGTYINESGTKTIILGQNLFVDENGFIDPYKNILPNGYGFKPGRDYLAPIPSDEITLNSNLVQNPGWE